MLHQFGVAAVAAVALTAAVGGVWLHGQKTGREQCQAAEALAREVAAQASQEAASAAAHAISKMRTRNVTIRQQLEREIQTREVFRDCRSGGAARGLLNATPGIAAASSPGDRELPAAGPAE